MNLASKAVGQRDETRKSVRGVAVLLNEIERNGRANDRLLNRVIALASAVRPAEGSRVVRKNKGLSGVSMGAWTQAVMRGTSAWSIGERELMAAMVAKWNACAFCADIHAAVAARHMSSATVAAALSDYDAAPISKGLKMTLAYLEMMTLRPQLLTEGDATVVLSSGISAESLNNAIAIGAMFTLIARYANALDFPVPTPGKLHRGARMLAKFGYRSRCSSY